MLYLLYLGTVIADGVTIKIGGNVWSFGLNFIVYLLVAAIVGFLAEFIVGWRLPFGFIGAIIAALIGIWLMTNVILINGIGDIWIPTSPPVPLIRALIGAIILVAIWHLITYGFARRRPRRYYYR
jgi:uncharacterized membrane protein YeaQ/YmgE (transglycosylase-associated protein family)